jgi:hypothetical protein
VGIDRDAGAKGGVAPIEKAFLGDGAVDELQTVFLGETKPVIAEREALGDGALPEARFAGIAEFSSVDLKVVRPRHREMLINGAETSSVLSMGCEGLEPVFESSGPFSASLLGCNA